MDFDFLTIDFETSNNNYNSACSIGLVLIKDKKIINTKYFLIKPPSLNFNADNIRINGITPGQVSNSPLFPEIWEQIKFYFNDTKVIAHNASFDMSVLKNCLLEYNLQIPEFTYIDSIPISTRACRGEGIGRSLDDRAKYFNINMGTHHNALDDAITCANLVIECLNRKHRKTLESYCSTYSSIPIKHFSELKPSKEFKRSFSNRFKKIAISEITATTENINDNNPFYNKIVVFTGELKSMDRKLAMQKVVNLGAILRNSVSSKTTYLIVGIQDKSLVGEDGLSSKEEKAYALISNGNEIKILKEDEFLNMI
ncbi:exonuclease domain-containing protein [Clostridium felsineum]|uniref:3'-5' exonuclease DinG n=1 Tax=Clostridium felsineum TaxID=36839 RepID=A0A1S8LYK1_9CLOT|nr:exonuclease domain-containing protein [Clostridium felsineum]URZ07564.1 3'-5' exonuclease DinG [Clostridium felsineum]URZ12595.1 3'-5' exonuclease DinG [Clostridium felsineum]